MCARKVTNPQAPVETTGHNWDGIEEYNNPLPRWWLWVLYATILWGIGYVIAFPAWPLLTRATQGVIGQDMRQDVADQIAAFDSANAAIKAQLVATDLSAIGGAGRLCAAGRGGGLPHALRAVPRVRRCGGAGGGGAGGGVSEPAGRRLALGRHEGDIHLTVAHGIRTTTDPDACYSEMPKFGADDLLPPEAIADVVEYVLQLSGQPHDAARAAAWVQVYADNCAACHLDDGAGDPTQGAPALQDAIWLYGGSAQAIAESVTYARFGVMPDWNDRLSEDEIRAVAFYVHGLGGGE